MTTKQNTLRLFVEIIAIASVCAGLAGYAGYARLGDVAGQAVFLSPYFSSILVLCGVALYAARTYPRHALCLSIVVMFTLALGRMAALWSDAWLNGRELSVNFMTALVLLGAITALLLYRGTKRKAPPRALGAVVATLAGVAISTLIAYALIEDSIVTRQESAQASAQAIAGDLQHRVAQTESVMVRLGERWNIMERMPAINLIQLEFDSLLRDFPFFHSFAVVDDKHSAIWERSRPADRVDWLAGLFANPELHGWLEHVHASAQTHVVPPEHALWGGNMGFAVTPLSNPDMPGWLVVASIDLGDIFAKATARAEGLGYFSISNGPHLVYQTTGEPAAQTFAAGDITIPVHHDFDLQLSYVYAGTHADLDSEVLPEFILLAGMLFTFLLISGQRLMVVARKRMAQRNHRALHDPLTGLPNRRVLEQTLKEMCARARSDKLPVSVVFFDLDGIKIVNDSMGHDVGDGVLVEVARRLRGGSGKHGTVARLGGDEFVLLFLGIDLREVQERTQRLISGLSKPYNIGGRILRVTASAGIASSDGDIKDPMQLVREADLAMLQAEQQGRNTWHTYTADMSVRVAERVALRNDLQDALDADGLELHYQPIIEGFSGRVIGVEALVRWPHPTHGYISPTRVIPLAEETGQIVPLTDWVIATACHDWAILRKHGLPSFPVIVNISPLYFQRIDFVHNIRLALRHAALPAAFLEIEITEGLLLDNEEAAISKLTQLREIGIKTSIDDFGTGYSSLNYLKNLPVDKVKIDRSFIIDVVSDPADAAVTQGIISMAHHLGLKVVAEGVETESQFAFLKRSHCDQFQGYLFARPMFFEALLTMLSENRCQMLPPEPVNERAPERILLLVDDEKNILNALTRLMRRDGYRILTANGPAEAFELLAKHHVQVIVSDQRMPEMNGTEFFSKVKNMYPATTRMILSGYTDLKSVTEAINHGAIYKFITKPWDDEALRKDIEHAFKKAVEPIRSFVGTEPQGTLKPSGRY